MIIVIIIYLIGCIFAYGKLNALFMEVNELYPHVDHKNIMDVDKWSNSLETNIDSPPLTPSIICSWLTFFIAIFVSRALGHNKYFLRFKNWDK